MILIIDFKESLVLKSIRRLKWQVLCAIFWTLHFYNKGCPMLNVLGEDAYKAAKRQTSDKLRSLKKVFITIAKETSSDNRDCKESSASQKK